MHPDFQRLMRDATRLVGTGDLAKATAVIQSALNGSAHAPPAAVLPDTAGDILDVEFRDVDGVFTSGRCGDGRAQRDYRLYVPPQAGRGARPLVVMLHGCTQDPDDFAAATRMNDAARAQGCYVLYPAQAQQANPQRCWNWFSTATSSAVAAKRRCCPP